MKTAGKIVLLAVLSGSIILSCSPQRKFNILSFFFDGVPPPNASADDQGDSLLVFNDSSMVTGQRTAVITEYYFHDPYQKRKCMLCHDESSMGNMTIPEPGLCFTCHEDFTKSYTFVHGPVNGGYCTKCHSAHMSKSDKMLSIEGQPLCLLCHTPEKDFGAEAHSKIGRENCTSCHNPHGGEDRYLLLSKIK